MLNQKKVRIMTRLAIIERKEEKNALRIAKYFRSDYVRFELLKTIIAITVAYAMIVIMGVIYYSEDLIQKFMKLDYKEMVWNIGIGYIGILLVYGILGAFGYFIKYNIEYKKTRRYLQLLQLYQKVCKEERREWKS